MTPHPPKPRLAFRVGVVGHRPDRLDSADLSILLATISGILRDVKTHVESFHRAQEQLFAGTTPILRGVSPLAEGADRIFAQAALALGYELCCPMPFPQAEFEQTFRDPPVPDDRSVDAFRSLLEQSARDTRLTRFEMDGDRAREGEAYAACGRVVLNQSDLLLVIWDGQRLEKSGGTEETLDEARQKGVPILWIDAHAPHHWQMVLATTRLDSIARGLRTTPDRESDSGALGEAVREALALPKPSAGASGPTELARATTVHEYYAEQRPWLNPALWKAIRDLIGDGQWSIPERSVPDFEAAVEDRWPRDRSSAHSRIVDDLRAFYAWPDRLAVYFSDLHRSAFVLSYALAGFAVFMALLPLALEWDIFEPHLAEAWFIAVELLSIVLILTLVWRGRRRRWHERWVDYRLAAELVRYVRLLAPLGGQRPFPAVPPQLTSYGDPGSTWMAWYVRGAERELGLPEARFNAGYLRTCVEDLSSVVAGQIAYHATNARRHHQLETRFHYGGLGLLSITLAACAAHLILSVFSPAAWSPVRVGFLVFVAGVLPAVSASLAGISNQGEFRRVAKRSAAMTSQLEPLHNAAVALLKRLNAADADTVIPRISREATDLAREAAHLMINEVLDWRVVFLDQPLKPS